MRLRTRGTASRLSNLNGGSAEDSGIESLARSAQEGDERAFTDIYLRYFDRVYGYMRVALTDPPEAEAASRQVFLKMVGLISGYKQGEQPFSRWLLQIARNEALDRLRRRDGISVEEAAGVPRWRESVRTDGLRARLRKTDAELARLIEQLPEAQRRTVLLRYVLDFEDAEIAEVLSVTPRDVRQLQDRALRVLKGRLDDLGRGGSRRGPARGGAVAAV